MKDLDTTINEPSATADEVEMLLFAQFAWKAGGLDAAGLSQPHPPSTMTLGGLVKHLAFVEVYYTWRDLDGEPPGAPWLKENFDSDPEWIWKSAADDPPEVLYTLWRDAVEATRAACAKALAGGITPKRRRLLVDLHDEYARHVGHADLLREAVDGLVGEDPPQ